MNYYDGDDIDLLYEEVINAWTNEQAEKGQQMNENYRVDNNPPAEDLPDLPDFLDRREKKPEDKPAEKKQDQETEVKATAPTL